MDNTVTTLANESGVGFWVVNFGVEGFPRRSDDKVEGLRKICTVESSQRHIDEVLSLLPPPNFSNVFGV